MSDEWHNGQVALQHKILDRMRSLGITPILPSFAGHVPDALKRIYPSANLTHLSDWGHFETKYCWCAGSYCFTLLLLISAVQWL